jgi:Flp pilus assembly pilin Flp
MKLKNRGQVMVEYAMILAVIVILSIAVLGKVRDYLVGTGGYFESYFSSLENVFGADGGSYTYKRYQLTR